jgi:thioredoxin 1
MKPGIQKILILMVLLLAVVGVVYVKTQQQSAPPAKVQDTAVVSPQGNATAAPSPTTHERASRVDGDSPRPAPRKPAPTPAARPAKTVPVRPPAKIQPSPAKVQTLPRLLELGADKCVPCKMMQPVLAELRQEYAGKLQVDFIDVWKDPTADDPYGIRAIPTQIFFDANGKEIFRHTGFFPKADILATFKEHGIVL